MDVDHLNLLIKPTLKCNQRCIYCHSLQDATDMTAELVDELFGKLSSLLAHVEIGKVSVNWHGGEPMVMGADFYERVLRLQLKHLGDYKIEHTMQSNVTLYRGELRTVLLDLLGARIIGACLDPFHVTRPMVDGEDGFPRSVEGCMTLLGDGFNVGMIYVVHKKSLEVIGDLYYFFKNLGNQIVYFRPVEEFEHPEYGLEPGDWADFLSALWEIWERDAFQLPVWPLWEWQTLLNGHTCRERPCEFTALSRNNLHIVISPEGDLYPCHRFQDRGEHCMGNILESTLEDMLSHPLLHLLPERKEGPPAECRECRHLSLCNSGCVATHDHTGKTKWCADLKEIFRRLEMNQAGAAPP